jgi:AraC-like DNA-binding protein
MNLLALTNCGIFRYGPHHAGNIGPATPGGQERIEILTDGHGWYDRGDGGLVEAVPGDLLWHVQGECTICKSENRAPYVCLSISLAVDPALPPRPVPRHTTWPELDHLRTFARELTHHFLDPRFDRLALMHYCYGRVLFQAQRSVHLDQQPDLPSGLAAVVERMHSRYWQDCSVPVMARLAGCSQSQLHALFAHHFQTTPHQFLLERRLLAAREQLLESNDELTTIARRCGFTDSSAFCRAFKRATGHSPQQWRLRERAQWPVNTGAV